MLHASHVAALSASLVAISLLLAGCGGGSGPSPGPLPGPPSPSAPAFDIVKVGLRAVSYAPMYLTDQSCIKAFDGAKCDGFPTDDFASPWAQPIWGADVESRGDLANLAGMGANAVRLYGNDPRFNKKTFFDEAMRNKMVVIDGLSTYWYSQGGGPHCAEGTADCHDAIESAYTQNLNAGFLDGDRYHAALAVVNVFNEPDFLGDQGSLNYLKAVVTGFDGILSAEKAAGVKPWSDGTLPRFTITWSFATQANGMDVCSSKYFIKDPKTECGPGLIFMIQFYRVIMDPEGTINYKPKNDLKAAFESRWINGVNLFVNGEVMNRLLLAPYQASGFFKDIHIFAGEWHPRPEESPSALQADLQTLTKPAGNGSLVGVSFFQYQVAYNKVGSEREFGLFELGPKVIGQTDYILGDSAKSHPINCLVPQPNVAIITEAWKGTGPKSGMCPSQEHTVVV